MGELNRRRFLATATVAGGLLLTPGRAAAHDRALRTTARRAVAPTGTTLEAVAAPAGTSGYRRLTAGPGWPLVVRPDLTAPQPGRDTRRNPVTSFVQFTDLHLTDAQSPVRFEYLDAYTSAAHRPQETLTTQGAAALVARVNALRAGPFTGRPFDFAVCTGDNTDNKELAELDWFLTVLNGGSLRPDTGDPDRYEGVQNFGSGAYWHPESATTDDYQRAGFPVLPGLLGAARARFDSPGLAIPWYSVFGNHDDSVQGTLPSNILLDLLYTGAIKLTGLGSAAEERRLATLLKHRPGEAATLLPHLVGPLELVTPDERRAPFSPNDYIAAHLDPASTGPGPHGHGFAGPGGERGYYAFAMAPGVVGLGMDSTNRAGFTNGSLGTEQLDWLERQLIAGSSRYYDTDGNLVRHRAEDTVFFVYSHHTSSTMDNLVPDLGRPLERRHDGGEVLALLSRFPNVLAWVNGHSHRNRITAHPHPVAERGFYEINTASHVDFPQQARALELADNADGTLSVFTTLIEADSPYAASYGDFSAAGLASLYRELAANDPQFDPERAGNPADRNTELVLPNPVGSLLR